MPAVTRNTITDWARLEREIELVRQTGLAYDHEEYIMGICAVAVAIRGPKDEIVSIALPAPTDRFQATSGHLAEALADRSRAFQRRI